MTEPWYTKIDSVFSNYRKGDKVIATCNCYEENIQEGMINEIESVSSDHHGGLQLNLIKFGRGWSNHVWRKLTPSKVV